MMSTRTHLALLLVLTAIAACGGDTPSEPVVDPATAVATVTINAGRTSLAVGSTLQLTADAANAAGTILVGKTTSWVSSHPNVATITSLGLVTGVATGATVITATSGGRSGSFALTVQAPNKITLTSDAGEYVGGGGAYTYTNANAIIRLSANATSIQLSISGDQHWNATFQVPLGAQLANGSYANATRWPFQGTGPGLNWSGEGRGCNTLAGSFAIDSISWSAGVGSSLLGLDMRFDQHCDGSIGALRGTIHWRADDPTSGPGPVTPIPSDLWQPPAGATPTSGDFVYLQSDQGDYIGQGTTSLYQTGIVVTSSGANVAVAAGGNSGNFQGMSSLSQVNVGYYGNLIRYPFNNPLLGGLDWSGNGRGCNQLTGWFVVDRVNYVNAVLVGIELRFEQHCEGSTAALHGAVRWGRFTS